MKLLIQILLMSSAFLAAPASVAGNMIQTAAHNWKQEAQQRFSLEGQSTRVKFKTAMGSRRRRVFCCRCFRKRESRLRRFVPPPKAARRSCRFPPRLSLITVFQPVPSGAGFFMDIGFSCDHPDMI